MNNLPSPDEIRAMPAGPELDVLVAQALGCDPFPVDKSVYWCVCEGGAHRISSRDANLKAYSADLRWVGEMLIGLRKYCEYDLHTCSKYNTYSVESNVFYLESSLELVVSRALVVAWVERQWKE